MKNIRLNLLMACLVAAVGAWAQGPNDSGTYYQNANGKSGQALRTALKSIINPHTSLGYDGVWDAYKTTDKRADGYVRDWYSNTTNFTFGTDQAGSYKKEGDVYNREHSVPQSWFNKANPMKCDVVHVIPTDGYVNNRRSNYPYGEVSSITYASNNSYSKVGSCKTSGYSGSVFEPNDEIKGDIARIYFYMSTCYADNNSGWGDIFTSTGLVSWHMDMMMRWSKQDPIDEVEIARNNAVYKVQKNRNPFVDYPGLEDYVWGSKSTKAFSYDNYEGGSAVIVAAPVFQTEAGTYYNKVEVTITCQTAGATIYYTTDGSDVSTQSKPYQGAITLTETTTLKAKAFVGDSESIQAEATYTIKQSGGDDPDVEILEFALNNAFFNCTYTGSISKSDNMDLTGVKDNISVVYSLGTGSNRYCSSEQIRVYPGNTLKVSVADGTLTAIEFPNIVANKSENKAKASTGTITDNTWSGAAQEVVFTCEGTSGHLRIPTIKASIKGNPQDPSSINHALTTSSLSGQRVIFNLRGQRVTNPTKGVYIVDGKKVVLGR